MPDSAFFIVHDADSFENHPNLIGFGVKTDLDKKPLRDNDGKVVPENLTVTKIKAGDRIVYYTLGDYLIRGIFTVCETLEEGDKRRAKDWSPFGIQFIIEPLVMPKNDVDFRNIIFFGKNTLNMFSHLDNLKKQWGMSVGGKNYIKEITQHDFKIFHDAVEQPEIELEEPAAIPKFSRDHLANQLPIQHKAQG